jgi:hypothetical protein
VKLLAQTQTGGALFPFLPTEHDDLASEALAGWASRINSVWARGTVTALELARVVHAARRRLARGEWSSLWKSGRVRFSKRKGDMLATIGKNLEGLNEQNSAQLPSAWNTLYFLSLLGLPLLLNYIDAGTVHPGLTLREARELWRRLKGASPSTQARLTGLRHRLKAFARFLRTSLREWPAEQREHDQSGLTLLSKDLRDLGAEMSCTLTAAACQQRGNENNDTAAAFPPAAIATNGQAAPTITT